MRTVKARSAHAGVRRERSRLRARKSHLVMVMANRRETARRRLRVPQLVLLLLLSTLGGRHDLGRSRLIRRVV